MDYTKLEPGIYIQQGAAIKRVAEYNDPFIRALLGNNYNEPERLAAAVGWVFVALEKREAQMRELYRFGQWKNRAGTEIDDLPFKFWYKRDFVRIDKALQLHGNGYLLKQRSGRRIVGLRFLDPATVQPDENSAEAIAGGVRFTRYWRNDPVTKAGVWLDAEDVIHFRREGLREIEHGDTAGNATLRAANILFGISQMFDTFYQNNGLPVMLVEVPMGTSLEDKDQLENRFWRIFNARRGSDNKPTIGVREGVKVTPLSIKPNELDAQDLEESQVKAILAAHDIPWELVFEAPNLSVAQDRRRDLVGSIAQRLDDMAEIINYDVDIARLGISYDLDVQEHYAFKQDEQAASLAYSRFVQNGMTPWAAAYLVMGILSDDAFPPEIQSRGIWVMPEQAAPAQGAEQRTGDDQTEDEGVIDEDEAMRSERSQFRRWYKKRMGGDVDSFAAKFMSRGDKLLIADEMLRSSWELYP
jgi:hypothetical protein